MKTIVKAAMLFASAMMLFSSCLKEQTGLTVEDIPGVAKISGKLMINEGQAYEGGKFVELLKPAANYELLARVSNASLSPTSSAQGYTDYSVTTNEDGTFEIVIPAVDGGVDCELVAPSFLGVQSQLSSAAISEGQMLFENVEGKYSYKKNLYSLRPGDVEVVNGVYTFTPSDATVALSEYVDLCVAVGYGVPASSKLKKEDYQSSWVNYEYNGEVVPADGVDVVVKVTYGSYDDGSYRGQTIAYPGTTSDGLLYISLPCTSKEAMKSADIDVVAKEHLGKEDLTYYTIAYHNDDYTKNAQRSCDLPAGTYTFRSYDNDCSGSYNFDFFMPVVKIVMTVNQIDEGADEGIITRFDDDKENNASLEEDSRRYYNDLKYNYTGFWNVEDFDIEVK